MKPQSLHLALWTLLLSLQLSSPVAAQTLRLEFAQEGDPDQPRALVVVHDAVRDRDDLVDFFARWSIKNWARSQYCSLYSYEYHSTVNNLPSYDTLADDLVQKLLVSNFDASEGEDKANPYRKVKPTDERQPQPRTAGGNTQLLFIGHGHGGLVARAAATKAREIGYEVKGVAYVGTPLDGLSTTELVLNFTNRERSAHLNLPQPLTTLEQVLGLSLAWWQLTDLFDYHRGWKGHFAKGYEAPGYAVFGSTERPRHPCDNVFYGRNTQLGFLGFDGLYHRPLASGLKNGPGTFVETKTLPETTHTLLLQNSESLEFLITKVCEFNQLSAYLITREGIEAAYATDQQPIGNYWDDRKNAFVPSFVDAKTLYSLMWGDQ